MAKFYKKIVNLGFIPFDVIVCQGKSVQDTFEYLEKKYRIHIQMDEKMRERMFREGPQGKAVHFESHQTLIWLQYLPTDPVTLGILAHEATHAMNYILNTARIQTDHENDEVLAYGVGYIVQEVLKDMK